MAHQKTLRGFRLLRQLKNKHTTTTLLAQNDSRYVVLINVIVLGILLRNRCYEFSCKDQAQQFFSNLEFDQKSA